MGESRELSCLCYHVRDDTHDTDEEDEDDTYDDLPYL